MIKIRKKLVKMETMIFKDTPRTRHTYDHVKDAKRIFTAITYIFGKVYYKNRAIFVPHQRTYVTYMKSVTHPAVRGPATGSNYRLIRLFFEFRMFEFAA